MTTALAPEALAEETDDFVGFPDSETLADVLDRIGNVPLERILWTPRPGTATEADQLRILGGHSKRLVELVDGILVEKAMSYRSSLFAATLIVILGEFVRQRRLGVIGAPDALMKMATGRNRLPDIHFTPWDRIPTADAHLQAVCKYPPDLAIEVLSEGNTPEEMAVKRRDYFGAGARLVWIFDPYAKTVSVYTDPEMFALLGTSDTLDGGLPLPGFRLPLAELFDDPQLNPHPLS